jgi:hypothetical protein
MILPQLRRHTKASSAIPGSKSNLARPMAEPAKRCSPTSPATTRSTDTSSTHYSIRLKNPDLSKIFKNLSVGLPACFLAVDVRNLSRPRPHWLEHRSSLTTPTSCPRTACANRVCSARPFPVRTIWCSSASRPCCNRCPSTRKAGSRVTYLAPLSRLALFPRRQGEAP